MASSQLQRQCDLTVGECRRLLPTVYFSDFSRVGAVGVNWQLLL